MRRDRSRANHFFKTSVSKCACTLSNDNPYLHEKPLLFFTENVTGKVRDNVAVEQGRGLLVLGFGPEYEDMSITCKT